MSTCISLTWLSNTYPFLPFTSKTESGCVNTMKMNKGTQYMELNIVVFV